ncbi:MAG: beta-galactosidase [Armatimonadota bacterium]
MRRILLIGITLVIGGMAMAGPISTSLKPEWQPIVKQPLQYYGYPFVDKQEDWAEMAKTNANTGSIGAMWTPTQDASAPYGCGVSNVIAPTKLWQSFTASASFDGVAPCLATMMSTNSQCNWNLQKWNSKSWVDVAKGQTGYLKDNQHAEFRFKPQSAGKYQLVLSHPTGSYVAWWARENNPYLKGQAGSDGGNYGNFDFELQIHANGQWLDVVASDQAHQCLVLGPNQAAIMAKLGLYVVANLGNWNNPGFPYMPEWFMKKFPESVQLDQYNQPILGGMFGTMVPCNGLEHPAFVLGSQQFCRINAKALSDFPNVIYWLMGGESLYYTYLDANRWTDYSVTSLNHFRAWLKQKYGTLEALNKAWNSQNTSWEKLDAPRAPSEQQTWKDWLDFRFVAMAEHSGQFYQAFRDVDLSKPAFTCNHGTIFTGSTYAGFGWSPDLFASNSDGWETGQIIIDDDPTYFNMQYIETLLPFGKPYSPNRLAYKFTDPTARGGGRSFTPQAATRYISETIGSGAWHLGLVQWSGTLPDGEWGVRGTPGEKAIDRLFMELKLLSPVLEGMHPVTPSVAVYRSHPTWALRGYQPIWDEIHISCIQNQIAKYYLSDNLLRKGEAKGYEYLISLGNTLIDPDVQTKLDEYVQQGGILITDTPGPASERVGKGEIRRITNTSLFDAASILPDSVRTVLVNNSDMVKQPTTWSNGGFNGPRDAHQVVDGLSLGQTIKTFAEGLTAISINVPTYTKKHEYGLTLEAFLDGPSGELLGSTHIDAPLTDGANYTLTLQKSPPANATVYVRMTADKGTPDLHLGWWSDPHTNPQVGQAYLNDKPVPGTRLLQASYLLDVPARQRLETMALSDGMNLFVVFINTSNQPVKMDVDLRPLAQRFGLVESRYESSAAVASDSWSGTGFSGKVSMEANGKCYVQFMQKSTQSEAQAAVAQAKTVAARWKGLKALTATSQYELDTMNSAQAEGDHVKAIAHARRLMGQMGMRTSVTASKSGLQIAARLFDVSGKPLTPASIRAEFVPSEDIWQDIPLGKDGAYRATIPTAKLPVLYDVEKLVYKPFKGAMRINLNATSDKLSVGSYVDVRLP